MVNEPCTLSSETIESLVNQICESGWMGHGYMDMLFQVKANRDAVFYAAKKKGAIMKRGTTGHCILDPRYTVEGRHLPDRGLANDQNSYGNLYKLERVG